MSCEKTACDNTVILELACEHCNLPIYCSENCRRADWYQYHQFVCPSKVALKLTDFDLSFAHPLGKGAFGQAFLTTHRSSGKQFALKRIKQPINDRLRINILREIEIHKQLKHPNLIKLYAHFEDEQFIYLILEYAENGSLFYYSKKIRTLTEEKAWHFFTQIAIGIYHLHQHSIIHRDLKPENILLDKKYNVKICDFGTCVQTNDQRTTFTGTLQFMAPEMINKTGHSFEVDLWALGVILYELLHGYLPFESQNNPRTCQKIKDGEFRVSPSISVEAKNLMANLIRRRPEDRLKLNQVLAHPWVRRFAPECEYKINQVIEHPIAGEGVICVIEGLICGIQFKNQKAAFPLRDLYKCQVRPLTPLPSTPKDDYFQKEEKMFDKLEKICRKPHLKSPKPVKMNDEAGGILENYAVKDVVNIRAFRNPLNTAQKSVNYSVLETDHTDPVIDTSTETLLKRQRELERLSSAITERDTVEHSQPKPVSFWARWFGCGDRS